MPGLPPRPQKTPNAPFREGEPQIAHSANPPVQESTFVPKLAATEPPPAPLPPQPATVPETPSFAETPAVVEQPQPVAATQAATLADDLRVPTISNLALQYNIAEAERQQEEQFAIKSLPKPLQDSIVKLMDLITDDISTEVTLNGPHKIGVKQNGQRFIMNDIDFIDDLTYHAVINSFILPYMSTGDRIGIQDNLIESQLNIPNPTGSGPAQFARVTILLPPAVPVANITISKKAKVSYTLDDLIARGMMTNDMGELLRKLAKGRATIVFSGATGTGKTTLLEALSHEFDPNERIVLVEDTPELQLSVNDLVKLQSHQLLPNEDPSREITLEWLVKQANRIRPDRVIVGECRGSEILEFLRAANSGMDGSMTTIHADNPQRAIFAMVSLAAYSKHSKNETSLLRDIAGSVDIIVQLDRINGRHIVSQIEEISSTVSNSGTGGIQTATIYRYDRTTERFNFENRMSDEFITFLRQRGVEISSGLNQTYAGYSR